MARRRLAGWFQGYRSALAYRDLRLLLGALFISTAGSWAYNVVLLAFVYERSHSLGWVSAAGLARFLPSLLLSAYGGVIAERAERIRLMVGSDLGCALWQTGLVLVAALHGPLVLALVFSILTAATNVVYNPAVAATIPTLTDEDDLVAANALNSTIENLVVIVGPAIGALLLAVGSAAVGFGANAASFALSALLVSRIRSRSRPVDVTEAGSAGVLEQVQVGARTIMGSPAARTLVALSTLVSFVYGTDTVLFVAVSEHRLGTGPEGFGYLLAGVGIGGILMAAAVDRLSGSRRLASIILAGTIGFCLPTALMAVIHSIALAVVVQIVRGGATLIVDVLAVTSLQRAVPADQLARVFGVFFAFILGAIALGTLITPPIISALGLNGALLTMAFAPSLLGLLAYPELLRIDRQTAERADLLAGRVAVLERLDIFAAASRTVLERLASAAAEVKFGPGKEIVCEGEPADALYVLVEGEVEVSVRGETSGAGRHLRSLTAPAYFGEIGVLERIPRTATVRARGDCRCDRIDGDALLATLTTTPPSSSLMEVARGRLAVTHPSRQITFAPS